MLGCFCHIQCICLVDTSVHKLNSFALHSMWFRTSVLWLLALLLLLATQGFIFFKCPLASPSTTLACVPVKVIV